MLKRPALLLRLEALTVFLSVLVGYVFLLRGRWPLFLSLFLLPDLSLLAYLSQKALRAATALYNLAHTSIGPVLLF
jgi:hypothetical protein